MLVAHHVNNSLKPSLRPPCSLFRRYSLWYAETLSVISARTPYFDRVVKLLLPSCEESRVHFQMKTQWLFDVYVLKLSRGFRDRS